MSVACRPREIHNQPYSQQRDGTILVGHDYLGKFPGGCAEEEGPEFFCHHMIPEFLKTRLAASASVCFSPSIRTCRTGSGPVFCPHTPGLTSLTPRGPRSTATPR